MTQVIVEKKVLNENQLKAAELRERFREHGITCVNIISSPGSGKTALLEQTLATFPETMRVVVLT